MNEYDPHYLGPKIGGVKQSGIGKKNSLTQPLHHTREKTVDVDLDRSGRAWDAE